MNVFRQRGFVAFALASAAVVWGLGLFAALLLLPVYSDGQTLSSENGWWVAVPLAVPALLAALGWISLRLLCTGYRRGEQLTIGVLVLLGAFCFIGAASIGLLVVPVLLLLIGALTLTPKPQPQ